MSADNKRRLRGDANARAVSCPAMHLDGVDLCSRVMKVGGPRVGPRTWPRRARKTRARRTPRRRRRRRGWRRGEGQTPPPPAVKPPFKDDNKDFYRAKMNSTEDRTFLRDGIRSNLPDGARRQRVFRPAAGPPGAGAHQSGACSSITCSRRRSSWTRTRGRSSRRMSAAGAQVRAHRGDGHAHAVRGGDRAGAPGPMLRQVPGGLALEPRERCSTGGCSTGER